MIPIAGNEVREFSCLKSETAEVGSNVWNPNHRESPPQESPHPDNHFENINDDE